MRPHQSCGLLCQLNHSLTREKSTVDKQHQFQRLARMNLNTATRPSRTAVAHQMDQLDVTDRPTCRCRRMCCCSRCWNKRQLTRTSHSSGTHLRSPGGREVNPRADAGQRRTQEARDWRCEGTDSPGICERSRFTCLLYSEAAARLIEMPYAPFYLHTLTYAAVWPPVASALNSSGETDGDSEFW